MYFKDLDFFLHFRFTGGALITMYGMFTGVVLSNLKAVDLGSSRNLAIIGTSIFTGLMVPYWIEEYTDELYTGRKEPVVVLFFVKFVGLFLVFRSAVFRENPRYCYSLSVVVDVIVDVV